MARAERIPVIILPGAVMPAALAYEDLVTALGPEVDARPKELEIYAGDDLLRGGDFTPRWRASGT